MRIIKRGTDPKDVPWRGRCVTCRSELECKEDELTSKDYDQKEQGYFGRAMCPVCGTLAVFYPRKANERWDDE